MEKKSFFGEMWIVNFNITVLSLCEEPFYHGTFIFGKSFFQKLFRLHVKVISPNRHLPRLPFTTKCVFVRVIFVKTNDT